MTEARDRFVRLAESRTTKLLKDISLLSNLSNRSNYSYTADDVHKIFSVITAELKEAQAKFDNNLKAEKKVPFKL